MRSCKSAKTQKTIEEQKPVAAGVLLLDGNHVMLMRNLFRGWENPGGKAKKGETPRQTATRELREEVGTVARSLDGGWVDYANGFKYYTYTCNNWSGQPRSRSWEVRSVDWFTWPEAVAAAEDWLAPRLKRIGRELGYL